jgi:hypothetical protein
MKSLKELEVEAYLAGALVSAELYTRTEDAEANNDTAFTSQVDETEKYIKLLYDCEQDLMESFSDIFQLQGKIAVLEDKIWRLEKLEE